MKSANTIKWLVYFEGTMYWWLENLKENLVIILFTLQEKFFPLVSDIPFLSSWYLYLCSPH
jgi:hypothetical protein